MFNPEKYWEERLSQHYSIIGVGDITLGKYNNYLYKVRRFAFKRIIKKLNIKLYDKHVADIGAGTGFFINLWKKAKSVTGFDITNHAVTKLKEIFTDSKFFFYQSDISSKDLIIDNKFDIISAFDVLYHITDDDKYNEAFKNINRMLSNTGILIFSDNLIRENKEFRIIHQVCRSKEFVLQILKNNGFEVQFTRPMFYLMNTVFYPNNIIQKYSFPVISRLIYKFPKFAGLIGLIIYPFEIISLLIFKETRSTEIIVCKKVNEV
ncbi:MAG: class I SAM-dependent methyltransferase [Bacteroidales bacterium]|nr:class I SAM-dependent methyltransferase [Bacteroidales bacterium]MBN2757795.1 class I SAM-dependent methyltransferase [Bacteroidales bacterium]